MITSASEMSRAGRLLGLAISKSTTSPLTYPLLRAKLRVRHKTQHTGFCSLMPHASVPVFATAICIARMEKLKEIQLFFIIMIIK